MRAFKGNTSSVGQVPIFVGTSYDTVLKVYERLDDIVRMGNLLEQTSDFLFFHFDVPWESLNQSTFTGPDKHGRTMAIIDQPIVYVNGERVPQGELTVLGEGTTLQLANPVAPGDQVHIAAFGLNADGTLYFHPLLAIDRLLQILSDTETLRDQMIGHVGAVTSLTNAHQASMDAYDLTLAAAKDTIDNQVIAVGDIYARAQSVWINGGFELGDPSVKGIPYGWQGHGANLTALGTLAGSSANVPADSAFKSTRSFGSAVSNLGPWWYISKIFKVSGGDQIVANYRYWSVGFLGSSPASLDPGFLDSNDTFLEVVSYDAEGAVLETTRSTSFSQKTWAGTGAKPLDQTWTTTNHDPITLHANAAYAEVRLVFANGTGAVTDLASYQTTGTAGNHGGFIDDVSFQSVTGKSLIEINASVLGSAIHAKTAQINSQSSQSFASDAESYALLAAQDRILAEAAATNAGIIQSQVALALTDAQTAAAQASTSQTLSAVANLEAGERGRGNYIGKATFEDGLLGNWGPTGGTHTVELVPEVHPLVRLKALSQTVPGYVWYAPSNGGGWYEENLNTRTFELDAWVYNDTLAVVEIGIEAIRASDGSTVYFWAEAEGGGLASWFHLQERLAQITVDTVKWRPYLRMLDVGECYWTDLVFRDVTGLSSVEGVATAVATQVTTVQAYVDEAEGIATAMATTEATLIAQIDDVTATVTTQGEAIVDLQNGASAGYLVKAQAGGAVSLLELVAASDGTTPPTSIARISAQTILLEGSVSTNEISADAIEAHHLKLTADRQNLFPDFDMLNDKLYTGAGVTYSFIRTSADELGERYLQIGSNAAEKIVYSKWFPIAAGATYRAEGGAWLASAAAGSGTAQVALQFGTVSDTGAVTVSRQTNVCTRTDTLTYLPEGSTKTTNSNEKLARFVFIRNAGGTAQARFGGCRLIRMMDATLAVDGLITAGSAIIGDLAVDTIKIADNAVTIPVYVYQANNVGVSNITTEVTIGTGSITRAAGLSTRIGFSCQLVNPRTSGNETRIELRLYRGATLVVSWMFFAGANPESVGEGKSFVFVDTNTAGGATTYTIKAVEASSVSGTRNGTVSKRTLEMQQFKK